MNAYTHHFSDPDVNPGRDLLRALHENPLDIDHAPVVTERDAARRLFRKGFAPPVRHGSFTLALVLAAGYGLEWSRERNCHTYRDPQIWNTHTTLRRVIGVPITRRRCTNPRDIPGALVGVVVYAQTQIDPDCLLVVARFFDTSFARDPQQGSFSAEPVMDVKHSRITVAGHPLLLEGMPTSISQFVIDK